MMSDFYSPTLSEMGFHPWVYQLGLVGFIAVAVVAAVAAIRSAGHKWRMRREDAE
jgi:hypothetical protein